MSQVAVGPPMAQGPTLALVSQTSSPLETRSVWTKPNQNGGIQTNVLSTSQVPAIHRTAFSAVRRPGVSCARCASSPTKLVAAMYHHVVAMIGNDHSVMSWLKVPENSVQKTKASTSETAMISVDRTARLDIRSKGLYAASANAVAMAAPISIVPMLINGVGPTFIASKSAR